MTPSVGNAEGALHLSHDLGLCLPWQSPLLGFAVSGFPIKLPVAEGWTSQCQSCAEQDTAVLSLPLTVLKKTLLHEPCWCPLKEYLIFICPEEWSSSI